MITDRLISCAIVNVNVSGGVLIDHINGNRRASHALEDGVGQCARI